MVAQKQIQIVYIQIRFLLFFLVTILVESVLISLLARLTLRLGVCHDLVINMKANSHGMVDRRLGLYANRHLVRKCDVDELFELSSVLLCDPFPLFVVLDVSVI